MIVNIHLLGAEAHDLLKKIKRGEGSRIIPAIAIVNSEREKYLDDGTADAFLMRPFDSQSLITIARSFIRDK